MIVYMLQNTVNHKVYIGQTRNLRLSKRRSTRPSVYKDNAHLANAVRKYGPDSFSLKILCHASCMEELNLLERFWIAFYQSADRRYGYNKTLGGQPCQHFTEDIRAVLSRSMREVWRRGTHRNHAEAIRRWWRNLSDGERRLIRLRQSLALRGRKIHNPPWNKGLKGQGAGRPSARKGRKFGPQKNPCRHRKPFTEDHKRHISQALRRYHRQGRRSKKG